MSKISVTELPTITGFLYNPKLLYAPNRFLPMALDFVLPYCDHNWQPRFYTVQPLGGSLGAGLTNDVQLRMIPGSVIIGSRIATLNGFAASNLSYLIRDSNTQKNFTDGKSRYITCSSLVPSGASGAAFCLLSKPYKVGGGVIVYSVSNKSTTTAATFQILVYVLEPVQSPTASATGSIMLARDKGKS